MELQIQERKVQVIRTNVKPGAEVLRVAACCRVSTDSEEQLDSFISQMHYYLVGLYADEGIIGTSILKRDDFNRMTKCTGGNYGGF